MQTISTYIARQLNTMSYPQKQAVRTLVEMLIITGTPDTGIKEILAATTFMSDLLVESESEEEDQDASMWINDNTSNEASSDEDTSDTKESSADGEDTDEESSGSGSDMDISVASLD